jgi:ferredoxin-NADP reductase
MERGGASKDDFSAEKYFGLLKIIYFAIQDNNMAIYKTKLVKKEEVAEGTMAFYFEKPEGFNFIAGQYMTVSLINPPETDAEGNSRFFSIVSAPNENRLMVATRMRDTALKRILKNLPVDSEITIDGPDGLFYLPEKPLQTIAF